MMEVFYVVSGHFFSALLLYLNHRFIFHSKLGNTRLLRGWKKVHTIHHKHDYGPDWKKYLFIPAWAWVGLIGIAVLIGLVSNAFFALGMFSYMVLYEIVHYKLHKNPAKNSLSSFHYWHHRKDSQSNFASVYMFIDKIFKTNKMT